MSSDEQKPDPYFFHSPSLKEFAPAFIKAQRAMGAAHKGSNNPFFKSKYADLGEVVETVKDPLNDNGIGYLQFPVSGGHGANVITMLLHESGEFVGGMFDTPAAKNDAQGFGSAITYGRRYSLQAACGVPAVDDDGNAASGKKPTADLGKEMTKAFPPGEENSGLLLAIEPPDGTNPPIARIQTLDGILGFHIFGDESRFASLVQKEVIYKYGKNGKFRPIEAMRLKPIEVKTKVVELPPPTPPQELPPVSTEAPPHVRGTVESVKVKTGKKGEYAILVIADQGGSKLEVFCHKTPASCGVEDFRYLEDQEVFFTITESQVRDKTYLNIDELWLADVYAQAMAEAKQ